ncbi:metal-dependent phosphohydrolase, partial [Streptomyces sp. SID2955]|nr:metal-dependent phosphohydrolase [Streptomyces sp. SID2955]
MDAVPARARGYVAGVALLAALCLLRLPATGTPWAATALLAALYAACEHVVHRRFGGPFYPVLLAGAFLLPPAAAALVPVPAALLSPVEHRPALPRRVWRAAQPALAVWGAA